MFTGCIYFLNDSLSYFSSFFHPLSVSSDYLIWLNKPEMITMVKGVYSVTYCVAGSYPILWFALTLKSPFCLLLQNDDFVALFVCLGFLLLILKSRWVGGVVDTGEQ